METAEFLTLGVLTSGVAALAMLAIAEVGAPRLIELADLVDGGSEYLRSDPWRAVLSFGAMYVLALSVAWLAAAVLHRGAQRTITEDPVWWTVFAARGADQEVFLSATLEGGRIVEGFLYSYTTDDQGARDLALKPPLWYWAGGERFAISGTDRVVLSGDRVVEMDVRYVDLRL